LRNNNILNIIECGFLLIINPTYLDLSGNRIRYLDSSVFRKQGQVETLFLSENMLQCLEPGIFSDCTNLRNLSLSANKISEISRSTSYGLENLENSDLSNNNIEELDIRVFEAFSISTNRHNHQFTKLKHRNLAQNKIRSFNFELYFPSSKNSGTSDPTYELVSLNVSSNRLDSLDATSVGWLKLAAAVTDLSGNPWKCECSALGEAWRELRHKLMVNCASPEDRTGRTLDVIEDLCPSRHIFVNLSDTDSQNLKTSYMNRSSSTEPEDAGEFADSDNPTTNSSLISERNGSSSLMTTIISVEPTASVKTNVSSDAITNINTDTSPAVVSTLIIVNGVLVACTFVGRGFIAVQLIKKLRKRSELPEHNVVYATLIETGTSVLEYSRLSL